jgi:hypothetical protein
MALNHFPENLSPPVTLERLYVSGKPVKPVTRGCRVTGFATKPVTRISADFPHDQDHRVTGGDRFSPLLLLHAKPLHLRAGRGLGKPVTTCHPAKVGR